MEREHRLPSYDEALEWGITPPPRPQWAPPREDSSSPRPRTSRARGSAYRPFSMSTIDETLMNSHSRPQTSSVSRPLSLLDIGLDAILTDALSGTSRSPHASLPTRPSTSQGFRSASTTRASQLAHGPTPPSRLLSGPVEPTSPTYSVFADVLPQHIRPLVPPTYAQHDPIARTYLLRSPLVYTTTGSSPQLPAYQLEANPSKTGRPNQLRIRALDHIESRTVSLGPGRRAADAMELAYDDDHTLYLLQVMQLLGGLGVPGLGFGPSWRVELQRDPNGDSNRNSGLIRFEGGGFLGTGKGLWQRSACKFWYMTKKSEPAFKTAHEWKLMNKYGWQPELDWNKRLMFSVEKKRAVLGKSRCYEWRDGKGRLVAVESSQDRLDLTGVATSMSAQSREALLACWLGKAWARGALTW